MTKIEIYNVNQYNKTGRLKKNAKAEFAIIDSNIDYSEVAKKIKELGYYDFVSPYILTNINAKNKQAQQVFIHQSLLRDLDEIITSPQKLLEALNN